MSVFKVDQIISAFTNGTESNSVSKIPISCTDPSGSFHMLKPGILYSHFNNATSMSLAVAASSSFAIEADPDDNSSVQFRVPAKSAGTTHDRVAFYISGSGEIGVGTKDPESSFDVRDAKQDIDPKLAKANKEKLLLLDRTAERAEIKAQSLKTARTIGGVSFDGSSNINLPGVNTKGTQDTSGKAGSAVILANARTIGGVSFNGSANIDLPGVNVNQTNNKLTWAGNAATATTSSFATTSSMTTGNASTATTLKTARTIGGVSFNGSANINLPGVNTTGNQNTSGNATTATTATQLRAGKTTLTFSTNRNILSITDGTYTWNITAEG